LELSLFECPPFKQMQVIENLSIEFEIQATVNDKVIAKSFGWDISWGD